MTGIYFRVMRDGKPQNVEIEHLSPYERAELLADWTPEQLRQVLEVFCTGCATLEVQLRERGLLVREEESPKCRVCGCTEDDCLKCILKTGAACWWVEVDLCSACQIEIT